MKKVSTSLMQATELLGDRSRWTKGAFARNADSKATDSTSPDACRFCTIGAMNKVGTTFEAVQYLNLVARKSCFMSALKLNDATETKHQDVMAMFMTATFLALADGK